MTTPKRYFGVTTPKYTGPGPLCTGLPTKRCVCGLSVLYYYNCVTRGVNGRAYRDRAHMRGHGSFRVGNMAVGG